MQSALELLAPDCHGLYSSKHGRRHHCHCHSCCSNWPSSQRFQGSFKRLSSLDRRTRCFPTCPQGFRVQNSSSSSWWRCRPRYPKRSQHMSQIHGRVLEEHRRLSSAEPKGTELYLAQNRLEYLQDQGSRQFQATTFITSGDYQPLSDHRDHVSALVLLCITATEYK